MQHAPFESSCTSATHGEPLHRCTSLDVRTIEIVPRVGYAERDERQEQKTFRGTAEREVLVQRDELRIACARSLVRSTLVRRISAARE